MLNYSIVITTFDKRFRDFLIPLIQQIKLQRPEIEVIVTVNGSCKAEFNETYRSDLLSYLSSQKNCFPTVFPNFQSLAKMWNRGILTASNDTVLVLNDDLGISAGTDYGFFDLLEKAIESTPYTFKINGSFSHFIIRKQELMEVGYFDERLLGLGEEDGDFYWRYHETYGRDMPSIDIAYIDNIQSDLADSGYTKGIRTAAKFNRDFIKNEKYKSALFGHRGMFDNRVKKVLKDQIQYPYEEFYRLNKSKV